MALNPLEDPNSDANRLAKLQSEWIDNNVTKNLIEKVTPIVPTPSPAPLTYVNTPEGAPIPQPEIQTPAPIPAPIVNQTPVVQAEVTPIPAPVKTEIASSKTPPVDFNAGLGREQDIMNNLKAFSDKWIVWEDLKKASGYDTASPEKKAIIDSYTTAHAIQSNLPVDENSIMNLLRTNSPIPDNVRNSPSFNTAKQNFNKVRAFSTYSVNNLVGAMNNGSLLPGTKVYNELLNDPSMKQKLTEAQTFIAKTPVDLKWVGQTTTAEILANNPTIANYLADGVITQDEYNKATNNTEIVAKAKDVETKTNKYNELKAKYDAIEDDTKAEFASRPIPQSAIDSVIADRQKSMYKWLVLAKWVVDSAIGTLTELKSESSNLFDTNLKLQATRDATKNAKDLAQYQEQLKTGDITSTDPFIKQKGIETAVESIVWTIPTQRSKAQIVQDILKSGNIQAGLSELTKQIQSKPEYIRQKEGNLTDREKLIMQSAIEDKRDQRNFSQQVALAKMSGDTARQNYLFQMENDPEKKLKAQELEDKLNANKSLFDVLGVNAGTYDGNRGYDLAWKVGDPLPAGGNWTVKSTDTAGEQVGSIFLGGKWSKPYGNTVVMEDENGNQIRYSHLDSIWVKAWDTLGFWSIVGTRGNTGHVLGKDWETLTPEQLKSGRWAHVDIEIKNPQGKLLSNADQVTFLKWLKVWSEWPLSDKKFTQFNQTDSKFKSDPAVKAFTDALTAGGDLIASLKSANGPGDVGAVFSFMKALDPASVVKEWEFKLARESWGLNAKFDNLYGKIMNGEQLTEEQRKAFWKISFEYIKNKWKMYDTKYNDMARIFESQGIPKTYLPTRITDQISSYEGNSSNNPVDIESEWNNL